MSLNLTVAAEDPKGVLLKDRGGAGADIHTHTHLGCTLFTPALTPARLKEPNSRMKRKNQARRREKMADRAADKSCVETPDGVSLMWHIHKNPAEAPRRWRHLHRRFLNNVGEG